MSRKRWKVEITYRDRETEPLIGYFDGIADLQGIVESGPNSNLIEQIVIIQATMVFRLAWRMKELLSESLHPQEDMEEVARLIEEDLDLSPNTKNQEAFIRSLFWEHPMARRLEELALKYEVDPESAESPVDLVH